MIYSLRLFRESEPTYSPQGWTYGAEHEWGDWPQDRPLPPGYSVDRRDITMVNSNGIAVDPKGITYRYGGEFNTPPTILPEGQLMCLMELIDFVPEAVVNYRSNLHIHIRIPGLREDLYSLKKVQHFIHSEMPKVLPIIEPIPIPNPDDYSTVEAYNGARRRARRRRMSHHTLLTPHRLEQQLKANTIKDFFMLEVPAGKNGQPLWTTQPRLCVNLRQLLETDTIEFRHFPGTMNPIQFQNCVEWCRDFMIAALTKDSIDHLLGLERYQTNKFPKFPEYKHWMEVRYRATVRDGTVPKEQILENIQRILSGEFDGCNPNEDKFEAAGYMPWQY